MAENCCAPSAGRAPATDGVAAPSGVSDADAVTADLITLPGVPFSMGTDGRYGYPADGEGPAHEVLLSAFSISRYAVTNAQFAAFVAATGHRTEAERFGWSFVFAGFLPDDFPPTRAVAQTPWWRQVDGADWAHPEGPHSSVEGRADHPVVHVRWNDAQAYCDWSGDASADRGRVGVRRARRARAAPLSLGRRSGTRRRAPHERLPGTLPRRRTRAADGYAGTAPVDAFPPNGHGLYDMTGNVWEWMRRLVRPGLLPQQPARRTRAGRPAARHA